MKYKLEDLSINPKILSENKYNKYSDSLKRYNAEYMESWQKTVYNDYGKAYFINFNFSDLSDLYLKSNLEGNPYSWEADLQFNTIEDDMTVNVKVFGTHRDLESVEKFCDKMFKQMQFKNYDYYSDEEEYRHKKEVLITSELNQLQKELPINNETTKRTKKKKI